MAAGSQDGAFQKDKPNAWLLIKPFLALHLLIFKDREAQEERDIYIYTQTHTHKIMTDLIVVQQKPTQHC